MLLSVIALITVLTISSERALCTGSIKVNVCKDNTVIEDLDLLREELIKQNGSCGEMNIAIIGTDNSDVKQSRNVLMDAIGRGKSNIQNGCQHHRDTSFITDRLTTSGSAIISMLVPESISWCVQSVVSPESDSVYNLRKRLVDSSDVTLDSILLIKPASFFVSQQSTKQSKSTSIISYVKSLLWYPTYKINRQNVLATVSLLDDVRQLGLVTQPVLIVTGVENARLTGMFPHVKQALSKEFPEILFCEKNSDGKKRARQMLQLLYIRKYITVVDVVRELTEVYQEVVKKTGNDKYLSELSHITATKELTYQRHLADHRRDVQEFETAAYHNTLTSYVTIAGAAVATIGLLALSVKLLFPVIGKLKQLFQDVASLGVDHNGNDYIEKEKTN